MNQVRRRIFYIPGYFTLIFLFPLCYIYLQSQEGFKRKSVIEVNYWSPKVNKYFRKDRFDLSPPGYYVNFKLTGQVEKDTETLRLAQIEIRKQKIYHNFKKGVHFHFEKKARYWTFVKVFDICLQEKAKNVLPYYDDIWVLQF